MNHAAPGYDIDLPDLAHRMETLPQDEINRLPYGVIRLDADGNVVLYSDVERENSGFRKEALTRPYFTDIAPCLDNAGFRHRVEQAMAGGTLDIAFDYTSDLPSGARDVDMHIRVQSAAGGGCWIFVQIED